MPRSRSTIRVASAERKARSWVTKSNAPANSRRYSSSHWIASMSRWFVGSSSSSRSGWETSALPSSVRRRQPPESSPSDRSAGSDSRDTTSLDALLEPPAVALLELVLQLAQPLERVAALSAASSATSTAAWWYGATSAPSDPESGRHLVEDGAIGGAPARPDRAATPAAPGPARSIRRRAGRRRQ